jgi:acyl dehydratase
MTIAPPTYEPDVSEALAARKALIGRRLTRPLRLTGIVDDAIARYSRAIGSRDRLRLDPGYGRASHWGRMVGHPTMLGAVDDTFVSPPIAGYQRLYGAAEWEFFQPLLSGDFIRSEARLIEVEAKEGSFAGSMLSETAEVRYHNQHGQLVAASRPVTLQVRRREAVSRGKYAAERHLYTEAELEQIWQEYESEEIRGSRPRYWEELNEGEPIGSIVKGPMVLEDLNAYVGCVTGTLAWSEWFDYMRRHPEDVYWDPDTGLPDTWQAAMWTDKIAQAHGFPLPHSPGTLRVAWMDNLVSNWAGDHGFLKRLSVRLSLPCYVSDTSRCRGRIVSKEIRGGSALATLSLWSENQRGEVTATGSAEVLLPSRDPTIPPPLFEPPARQEPPA